MKKVTFGDDLAIIEYPIILGDNPACTNGCPITIGWQPIRGHKCNLHIFEYARSRRRTPRNLLMIPVKERTKILLDAGFAWEEIIQRIGEVAEIRYQRQESFRRYSQSTHFLKFGKLSKNFVSTFSKLGSTIGIRPSNSKKILIAQ